MIHSGIGWGLRIDKEVVISMKWWILLFILSLPMAIMSGLQIIMPLLEGVPLSSIGWNPIPLLFTILFLVLAIRSVKDKATNKGSIGEAFRRIDYIGFMCAARNMDKNFHVSNACTKCEICKKVCPVDNIDVDANGKPRFKHRCEQCLSCLQCCPAKAINYKDQTQNRKRYTHPEISWKELAQLHGKE